MNSQHRQKHSLPKTLTLLLSILWSCYHHSLPQIYIYIYPCRGRVTGGCCWQSSLTSGAHSQKWYRQLEGRGNLCLTRYTAATGLTRVTSLCIQMGSDVSHLNVSLINSAEQRNETVSINHNHLKRSRGEPKRRRGVEPASFRLPAERLNNGPPLTRPSPLTLVAEAVIQGYN